MAAPMETLVAKQECSFSRSFDAVKCEGDCQIIYKLRCDISDHLIRFKSGPKDKHVSIPEGLLILYRAGLFTVENATMKMTICDSHRDKLSTQWYRCKRTCAHPLHPKTSKEKPDRGITLAIAKEIWVHDRTITAVGDGLCRSCVERHKKTYLTVVDVQNDIVEFHKVAMNFHEQNINRSEQMVPCSPCFSPATYPSEDYVDEMNPDAADINSSLQIYSSEISSTQSSQSSTQSSQLTSTDSWKPPTYTRDKLNRSMDILSNGNFKPLRYSLTRPLSNTHQSTSDYITQKANECVQYLFECIAPNQTDELMKLVFKKYYSSKTENKVEADALTQAVVKAYTKADGHQSQIQILSLIVNNFKKTDLCKLIPGLTKYKIDTARKYAATHGPGQIINPPKIHRVRMSKFQIQHFIQFLFSPSFSQAVGYGSKTLHLSSGLQIKIPKMIRTMIASRIINAYETYCEDQEIAVPSKATLYKIVKVCAASQKKSLKGLDSYTADGMTAIETLEKIVYRLEENGLSNEASKELLNKLAKVNQHLKFDMKLHMKKNSNCADHCITFALTDDKSKDFKESCGHEHTQTCSPCNKVLEVTTDISNSLAEADIEVDLRSEMEHDFDLSCSKLSEWKAHVVRTINQETSKTELIKTMKNHQALIIMDWAMKYLPHSFRESQQNWFGKQGISWHVIVVLIPKQPDDNHENCIERNFSLVSFLHILQGGTQGWLSVSMLLKDVLLRIKTLQPNLQEVFLKSDNAGCYHSLQLMAFIWKNNSLFDLQVKEYNFSEVQSGKDLCDSRTGTCRMHVLKFANEGNNIENPADLKRALESNKGVRNTFVTLVDISVENPPVLIGTIKHFKISKMSNFVFEDQGIRVYQAFGIGSGYLITNTILEKISRNLSYDESRIKIIEEPCEHGEETFNLRPTKLKLNNSVEHGDLSCTIPGCVKSFRKPSTLEQHLAIGQHIYHENDKITDVAMEVWAEKCTHGTNINYNEQQDEDNIVIGADFMDMPSNLKSGWALKSERKFVRFKASVKDYIKQIFDEGERTGKKANPLTVANKIRNEKNDAGGRLFAPDDWVSAQQVRGVFASLQLKLQKQNPEHPGLELNLKTEVDDDLNEVLTELDAIETLNIVDSVTEQIS